MLVIFLSLFPGEIVVHDSMGPVDTGLFVLVALVAVVVVEALVVVCFTFLLVSVLTGVTVFDAGDALDIEKVSLTLSTAAGDDAVFTCFVGLVDVESDDNVVTSITLSS